MNSNKIDKDDAQRLDEFLKDNFPDDIDDKASIVDNVIMLLSQRIMYLPGR